MTINDFISSFKKCTKFSFLLLDENEICHFHGNLEDAIIQIPDKYLRKELSNFKIIPSYADNPTHLITVTYKN